MIHPIARRTDKANSGYRERVVRSLIRRDGDECWYCGDSFASEGGKRRTLEHLIPLNVKGIERWEDWNMVLAHSRCNAVAGDRRLENKLSFRDALRRLGGYNYVGHREAQKAIGFTLTRKQRVEHKANRRAAQRWRFRASGAPGTAKRPLAPLGDLIRRELLEDREP